MSLHRQDQRQRWAAAGSQGRVKITPLLLSVNDMRTKIVRVTAIGTSPIDLGCCLETVMIGNLRFLCLNMAPKALP